MSEMSYKQRMAFDLGWKATVGAVVAFLLSWSTSFQILVALAVAAVGAWALIELGVVDDE